MTETPLSAKLKAQIRRDGPISVDAYMSACLHDPEHGYYRRQPAIGAGGDFVTAPEISQAFGELIGLWSAVVWQQMGAPERLHLVEFGPGRGTLMRDALRAARILPRFRAALAVHLIDSNRTLRERQAETLADAGVPLHFHDEAAALADPARVPAGPAIVVANEFLDAMPIEQFAYADGGWRIRRVALAADDETFRFVPDLETSMMPAALPTNREPRDGEIFEVCEEHGRHAKEILGARARLGPLAALFVDYGHAATGFGDTLQGVAGQAHASPFHAPGETDLSAQVDFQHFGQECRGAGLAVDGPLSQAELLGRLGIIERASRLMAANPARAAEIEAGVARLIAPNGMGSRFLALGIRSQDMGPLPGFES